MSHVHYGLASISVLKTSILSLLILLAPATLYGEDEYRAAFSDDLGQVTVSACFDGAAPGTFTTTIAPPGSPNRSRQTAAK